MTIEKKAKAYDEAIDKVAHFIKKHVGLGIGCIIHPNSSEAKELFNIFPELAESEDERIKRKLITFFQRFPYTNLYDASLNAKDILAWLEKQDMQKEINLVEILKHYPKETELYSPLYGKLWLAEVDEKHEIITCYKHPLDKGCTRAILEQEDTVSFYSNGTTGLPDFNVSKDCMLFLYDIEKQGKQEQDPCEHCKDICLNCHNFPCIDKRAFEQGKSVWEVINEEKVNNGNKVVVEPKFKVGDWITDGDYTWKIGYIEDDTYIEHCGLISAGGFIESIDKHYHLWSIKDAKDGDVLVDVYGNIGIFKERYGINWHTYCYLGNEGRFISEGGSHGSICYPATKEQRDTLMKSMTEAGYTFDFEKKELKEIKSKFKVGDTIYYNSFGRLVSFVIANIVEDGTDNPMYEDKDGNSVFEKDLIEQKPTDEEMKEALRTEYEKGRADAIAEMQNSAWSLEDVYMIKNICHAFEKGSSQYKWLKSLKDRVGCEANCTTTKEWSEEDETGWTNTMIMIKEAASNHYTKESIKLVVDWLKSLKSKNTWKPSEEQMDALSNALSLAKNCGEESAFDLRTLYEQLKKVRENKV